jgi:CheY-like chemotaxis protein
VQRVCLSFTSHTELVSTLDIAEDRELEVDPSGSIRDREWVLVTVSVAGLRTAVAAQAIDRETSLGIRFEPRDWCELERFALSGAARDASHRSSRPAGSHHRCPVLVVADAELQPVLRAMVSGCGFEVISANSGEEAFDHLRGQTVEMLVVDQNLPGMSACEFCRRLREERGMRRPVLMLAAHAFAAMDNEPSCAAADDYVLDPLRASELSARMLGLLTRAELPSAGLR